MIAALEHFLIISTLLSLAGCGLAAGVRQLTRGTPRSPHPQRLARLYAATVVLPPVIAAWLVLATLLPASWLGPTAFRVAHAPAFHDVHLLGDLTDPLEPALACAAVVFVCAGGFMLVAAAVRGHRRTRHAVARLSVGAGSASPTERARVDRLATRCRLRVRFVASDYPLAFLWGLLRPRLVVSSGLIRTLTANELTAVVEHEAAHHARQDNLAHLALRACSYASIAAPIARRVLAWYAEQVELICDEVAAAKTGAPLDVAAALVTVRRCLLQAPSLAVPVASAFMLGDARTFDDRVRRLVVLADAPPSVAAALRLTRGLTSPAAGIASIFVLTLVSVLLSAPLAVHRAAEGVIQAFR